MTRKPGQTQRWHKVTRTEAKDHRTWYRKEYKQSITLKVAEKQLAALRSLLFWAVDPTPKTEFLLAAAIRGLEKAGNPRHQGGYSKPRSGHNLSSSQE
jgi:hypothetical protein